MLIKMLSRLKLEMKKLPVWNVMYARQAMKTNPTNMKSLFISCFVMLLRYLQVNAITSISSESKF